MTVETMTAEQVRKKLAERKSKITTVVFVKNNGDVVRRTGMPKVYTRRVGGDTGPEITAESVKRSDAQKKALRDNNNVFFDSTKPGERGFSFNVARVVHI